MPGVSPKAAYFVRGSGHNKYALYTENSDEYQEIVDRLLVKWKTARTLVPRPVQNQAATDTSIGIIAYGSSDGAVLEALDGLAEHGDTCKLHAREGISI